MKIHFENGQSVVIAESFGDVALLKYSNKPHIQCFIDRCTERRYTSESESIDKHRSAFEFLCGGYLV